MFDGYRDILEIASRKGDVSYSKKDKDRLLSIVDKIKNNPDVNNQGLLFLDMISQSMSQIFVSVSDHPSELLDVTDMIIKLDKVLENNGAASNKQTNNLRNSAYSFPPAVCIKRIENINIARPVLEKLYDLLPDDFCKNDASLVIQSKYKDIGRDISDITSRMYARAYISYMENDDKSVVIDKMNQIPLTTDLVYHKTKNRSTPMPDIKKSNDPVDEQKDMPAEPVPKEKSDISSSYSGKSTLLKYIFDWAGYNNTVIINPNIMYRHKLTTSPFQTFSRETLIGGCNRLVNEGLAEGIKKDTYRLLPKSEKKKTDLDSKQKI